MSRTRKPEPTEGGYALVFVVIIAAAVVTAVGTIAAVSHVDARASVQNLNSTKAYAMAYAGLQHALATARDANVLVALDGRDPLTSTPCDGTGGILGGALLVALSGTLFHNVSTRTAVNPGGAGQSYDFGQGGYRLFLDDDYAEPPPVAPLDANCDNNFAVVLSSYGWYGTGENRAEALVETTFRAFDLGDFPGAITGCLASDKVQVSLDSKLGPGWSMMAFRIDGNGQAPFAFNYDPWRANGLSINFKSGQDMTNHYMFRDNTTRPDGNYKTAGPHQLGWPAIPATASVVDPTLNVGLGGWGFSDKPLGLNSHSEVYINNSDLAVRWINAGDPNPESVTKSPYNTPIIAYKKAPNPVERAEVYFNTNVAPYLDKEEKFASSGFYGCQNDADTQYHQVGKCTTGTDNPSAVTKFEDNASMYSGLAWNVIQTTVRKCAGSGNKATCAAGYAPFRNVARCLILPNDVIRQGGVGDWGAGREADWNDGNGPFDDAKAPNKADGHSWYPGGYPMTRVLKSDTAGWDNTTATLAQFGLCAPSTNILHVKYCDPNSRQDTENNNCLTQEAAWTGTGCLSIEGAAVGGSDTALHYSLPVADYFRYVPVNTDRCGGGGIANCSDFVQVKNAWESWDWGDFTRCDDSCSFEWDAGARAAGTEYWRSVCINLDPHHVHQYGSQYHYTAGNPDYYERHHPTFTSGERGSANFIVRLDMTDPGPLGFCNKGVGADTGTCLTNGVNNGSALGQELDNLTRHPRRGYFAPFSLMPPNNDPWVVSVQTSPGFCDASSDASAQLFDALEELSENPDEALEGLGADKYIGLTNADCVWDPTAVGPNEAGWYIKKCDDPKVVSWKKDSALGGNKLCGCGLLVVKYKGGKGKMRLDSNADEALVWRGMIVLHSNASGGEIDIEGKKGKTKSLFLDGGFLAIETGTAPKEFKIKLYLGDKNQWQDQAMAQVGIFVRYNPVAINEALSAIDLSYNAFKAYY